MAQAPAASIHIRLNADADVVPEQRWLYLEKDVLLQHLLKQGLGTWGSTSVLAQRLKSARTRYEQVLHADHLKTMLRLEQLPTTGERRLLEDRLASTPPKPLAELAAAVAGAAAAAAGGAAGTSAGAARGAAGAASNASPKQWKKELNRLAAEQETAGKKMTKEMCAAKLYEWRRLKEGHSVYHILSPVKGGVDHPSNYCVLPNYVPADYHLGDDKAKMHHILMYELLSETDIKHALVTSLGADLAAGRLAELKALVKAFKEDAAGCGTYTKPRTPKPKGTGTAQANGSGAPSAAQGDSEAGPSSAAQDGSQAGPSTDARSSKRARTEGEEDSAGGSGNP